MIVKPLYIHKSLSFFFISYFKPCKNLSCIVPNSLSMSTLNSYYRLQVKRNVRVWMQFHRKRTYVAVTSKCWPQFTYWLLIWWNPSYRWWGRRRLGGISDLCRSGTSIQSASYVFLMRDYQLSSVFWIASCYTAPLIYLWSGEKWN